ncbi:DUF599-domain-containing protein [Gonapodya prolifera JEL478]|uniref:DUF599-domain-containing protein n=1 Tax=Gonapodya prolifera (strain JEL478) TaxID=1344416 RepID=A0A139AZ88_GONPJ|nr:DUF599-domain-containing protein [Gonapodya prolifera JEL478]|eukprot:KXS22024.1 DUF599-domain-containing protein [Gonapodya prolifera JEL478]
MEPSEQLSLALAVVVLVLFLSYHVFMFALAAWSPNATVLGSTRRIRKLWVAGIMRTGDQILAVQSMRNWLMASSLAATVSVAVTFGITSFVSGLSKLSASADDYLGLPETVRGYKIVTLIVLQMLAFFCFVESMRYVNHVIFLINVRWDAPTLSAMGCDGALKIVERITPTTVARVLNTGNLFFTLGTRLMYLSVPCVMWFFGHWPMFAVGILLPPILSTLDFHLGMKLRRAAKRKNIKLKVGGDDDAVLHGAGQAAVDEARASSIPPTPPPKDMPQGREGWSSIALLGRWRRGGSDRSE